MLQGRSCASLPEADHGHILKFLVAVVIQKLVCHAAAVQIAQD